MPPSKRKSDSSSAPARARKGAAKPRRRGRPPEGPYEDKSVTLTTRITPKLREALDISRRREHDGRTVSLSQEVEWRLRRSFEGDRTRWLDNDEHKALAYLLVRVIESIESVGQVHWASSAFTTEVVARAAEKILMAFRPEEDEAPPPPELVRLTRDPEAAAEAFAGGILDQIKAPANSTLPGRTKSGAKVILSRELQTFPAVKRDLGDLADRIK